MMDPMTNWIATRAEGEKIMAACAPRMGRHYANGRNTDHGPAGAQGGVAAVALYSAQVGDGTGAGCHSACCPRARGCREIRLSYFKGWLERRPQVWASYRTGLDADLAALDRDRRLRRGVVRAMDGQMDLECFDA
jgi:deoxyribodipyrimidine photo-lyase